MSEEMTDEEIMFWQNHYWLWCLKFLRLRCLLGFHYWIGDKESGWYCTNCPKEKAPEGIEFFAEWGK